MKINLFVKYVRKQLGLTQQQFAELLKIKRASIANYETGRTIPPGNVLIEIQYLEKQIDGLPRKQQ